MRKCVKLQANFTLYFSCHQQIPETKTNNVLVHIQIVSPFYILSLALTLAHWFLYEMCIFRKESHTYTHTQIHRHFMGHYFNRTAGYHRFTQMLLKEEEIVHKLGTVNLYNVQCGVCLCVRFHNNYDTCPRVQQCDLLMFLNCFWSTHIWHRRQRYTRLSIYTVTH